MKAKEKKRHSSGLAMWMKAYDIQAIRETARNEGPFTELRKDCWLGSTC